MLVEAATKSYATLCFSEAGSRACSSQVHPHLAPAGPAPAPVAALGVAAPAAVTADAECQTLGPQLEGEGAEGAEGAVGSEEGWTVVPAQAAPQPVAGAMVHAGWTPLHLAAEAGDEALVALLLEEGAPVDATDSVGPWAGSWARA